LLDVYSGGCWRGGNYADATNVAHHLDPGPLGALTSENASYIYSTFRQNTKHSEGEILSSLLN